MFKGIMTTCCCMVICTAAFADVCPSVKDIKSARHPAWKAYDSDNNKPLSNIATARFRRDIASFSIAEWDASGDNHAIHCYYSTEDGSTLQAYFARDNYQPNTNSRYWYQVTGMLQCAAGADKCDFSPAKANIKQVAEMKSAVLTLSSR